LRKNLIIIGSGEREAGVTNSMGKTDAAKSRGERQEHEGQEIFKTS